MNSKEFKTVFDDIATSNGFERAFGGWFKQSSECIAVLELQKSNFGDYYQLNIKIFVQGMFGKTYLRSKDLVKKEMGHITNGETQEYKALLNFDEPIDDGARKEGLKMLFLNHVTPFTTKVLVKSGIKELVDNQEISLLPAIEKELGLA